MKAEALRGEQLSADGEWDQEATEEETQTTYLMFRLGARIFAVDVRSVREVLVVCDILRRLGKRQDVVGMIDLRNQGIAIVDLASRLGMSSETGKDARIIVFEIHENGKSVSLGVVADQVLRVREVLEAEIESVANTGPDWQSDGVEGLIRTRDGIALILRIESFLVRGDVAGDFDFG